MKVRHVVATIVALSGLSAGTQALAQAPAPAPAAPNHVHYTKPPDQKPSPTGALAPRLQNLGPHTFPVSTKNAKAQLFINQGLNLAYAFNHAESHRSFREAARLDPDLAMAHWGQALVLGPNINALMEPNEEPNARQLAEKAASLKGKAAPRERALIDAVLQRYSGRPEDRRARDQAYAAAMRKVHQQFPEDPDIAMLYVESVMDLRPWGYWTGDGRPHEGIAEVVALTEKVIARHPKHPGALHMYVHLMEAHTPQKAEKAADALLTLMPAAGHMVHMPSHIYQRVGRYADAARSNELAMQADEDYITQCRAQGLYPMAYYPHNIHFYWFAASAEGRSAEAIESARKLAARVDDESLKAVPILAAFRVVPYYALTRFGRWDEMLKEPEPAGHPFLRGTWHYARGIARVARGELAEADQELARLNEILKDPALDQSLFSVNTGRAVLSIAPAVLGGEIAAARRDYDAAIALLSRAVRLEDGLVYTEPAEWHYPPRHALGAVLLEAGRPAEAETVYWDDLRRNPENGWALFGVWQALAAQGKKEDAALAEARFRKAWTRADVKPNASRFGRQPSVTTTASGQ
jgi:tetratricopeptide (TPR) repeat protein